MGSGRSSDESVKQRFLAALDTGLQRCEVEGPVRLLVAFSGGADSAALLIGLNEIAAERGSGIEIEAAHFNHQLRGASSDADENFCRETCERLGVTFHTGTSNVAEFAAETGHSTESAARELRYRFLADLTEQRGADAVVVGHTADDQAETVLLAITRGAGLRGLSGMAQSTLRHDLVAGKTSLQVIRPMLEMRRSDTEEFCAANGIAPRADESNTDPSYARNRVRHSVIPELQQINPEAVDAIGRLAATASADVQLIDELAVEALADAATGQSGSFSRQALRGLHQALRLHAVAIAYRQAAGTLRDLDMKALTSAVDAVTELDSGRIDLPNETTLVVEHDVVRFLVRDEDAACPYPPSVEEQALEVPRTLEFPGGGSLSARIERPAPEPTSLPRWQAIVNPEVVNGQRLLVRSRHDGDRFHALGMEVEMKLQDFLVNQHVPARWRDRVPLVLTNRGICWVAGERIAEWARVPENADEALLLEYRNEPATDPS